MELESTETIDRCLLCGATETKFLFWNYDRLYPLPGRFGTVECSECGLVMLTPRPTMSEIGKYYPDDYGAHVQPMTSVGSQGVGERIKETVRNSVLFSLGYRDRVSFSERLLSPFVRNRFHLEATYGYGDRFPRYVPGGKALEVGCGNGLFLSFLKKHGWDVLGVDMSERAAFEAKRSFDIEVILGQVQDSGLPENSFDYIHLSHVVEHFYDPVNAMKFIARLLKPGGTLYMEVPNAKGVRARTCGEFWYGWDAPRHVVMFSPETSRRLVIECGLEVTKLETGLSDTTEWEIVYKAEAASGVRREDRPKLTSEESAQAELRRSEAASVFENDPLAGDYIGCWAIKEGRAS